MCTSSEMVVTTTSIITVRPSTWMPKRMCTLPLLNQLNKWRSTGSRRCSFECGRRTHCTALMAASTQHASRAAMPTSDPFLGSFLPKNRMIQNDTAGIRGNSQALRSIVRPSSLQRVDLGQIDRALVAVDEQDDGEADADLGGGHGDDEQGEDLARNRVPEGPEGNQVDVDGVEDQLDRHQHEHAVAPGQHAVDARAEQEGGEEEELVEVHGLSPSSR